VGQDHVVAAKDQVGAHERKKFVEPWWNVICWMSGDIGETNGHEKRGPRVSPSS
jgi:hypothetical protein